MKRELSLSDPDQQNYFGPCHKCSGHVRVDTLRPELVTHRMWKGGGCRGEFGARWRPVGDESKEGRGEKRERARERGRDERAHIWKQSSERSLTCTCFQLQKNNMSLNFVRRSERANLPVCEATPPQAGRYCTSASGGGAAVLPYIAAQAHCERNGSLTT